MSGFVDADNPNQLLLKKETEPTSIARPAMLQWTLSTSDQYEDPSAHEIDVEKGMDEFSEVMDQFGS